jgi:hypothetical protein
MEEKLRLATTALRNDLAADHFEGRKRLSDTSFWTGGPPREGFFRIWQGSPAFTALGAAAPAGTAYLLEGNDGDGIPSYRATDHMLHFTVKLRGNRREGFPSVKVPYDSTNLTDPNRTSPLLGTLPGFGTVDSRFQDVAGTYASQWYEVVYFLRPNGLTTDGSVPRYTLYRRMRLITPDNTTVNWTAASRVKFTSCTTVGAPAVLSILDATYPEVSSQQNLRDTGFLFFNNPSTITVPQHRFGMDANQPGGLPLINKATPQKATYPILAEENPPLAGSDVLLSDVISFQVQVFVSGGTDFGDLPLGFNSFFNTNGVRLFDTWTSFKDEWSDPTKVGATADAWDYSAWNTGVTDKRIPLQVQILALKITLRVWDSKTQQARQITIIQDM